MNEREAILKLRDTALSIQKQVLDQQLVQIAIIAMISAVISTHGDKAGLHQEFGRFWTTIEGPKHAVEDMLQGGGAVAAAMDVFSSALGMTVP